MPHEVRSETGAALFKSACCGDIKQSPVAKPNMLCRKCNKPPKQTDWVRVLYCVKAPPKEELKPRVYQCINCLISGVESFQESIHNRFT